MSEEKLGTCDTFLKLRFYGRYWKIDVVMRLADLLRLHYVLYAGGSGNGEEY